MATSIIRRPLSGSDMGAPIGVSGTGNSTNTVIHNTTSGTSIIDEVYLYAQNNYSQAVELALCMGTTATNTIIYATVSARTGPEPIISGLPLFGSAGCQTIQAFVGGVNGSASVAITSSQVLMFGWVNRITQA